MMFHQDARSSSTPLHGGPRTPPVTPESTRGNRRSQFYDCTGELTQKSIPTTSHVVNGSTCQTQLLVEESRVDRI
jgi:hypothetical protein